MKRVILFHADDVPEVCGNLISRLFESNIRCQPCSTASELFRKLASGKIGADAMVFCVTKSLREQHTETIKRMTANNTSCPVVLINYGNVDCSELWPTVSGCILIPHDGKSELDYDRTAKSIVDAVLKPTSKRNKEKEKIKNEIGQAFKTEKYEPLDQLRVNWEQLRQYYDSALDHARVSFRCAIIICFFGFVMLAATVVLLLMKVVPGGSETFVAVVGTVGGGITELFGGTILIIYKYSLAQASQYHEALSRYQRYLSCINTTSLLEEEERQQAILNIIQLEMVLSPSVPIESIEEKE